MTNSPDNSDASLLTSQTQSNDQANDSELTAAPVDHEKMAPDPPTNMHSVMRMPLFVVSGFLILILAMGASLFMVWYNAYKETAQLTQPQNTKALVGASEQQVPSARTELAPSDALAIEALRQEINAIKSSQGPEAVSGSASIDLLLGRIDRLELKLSRAEAAFEAMAAINQLSLATQKGSSYEAQLVLARAKILNLSLSAAHQKELVGKLESLAPRAKSGLPSRAKLVMAFPEAARMAFIAAPIKGDRPGLGKEVAMWFKQNVTIRRIDRHDETDAASLIHAAELKVQTGDLEGAMPLIAKLPDPSKQALKPWTDEALARIEADNLVYSTHKSIESMFVEDLGPVVMDTQSPMTTGVKP